MHLGKHVTENLTIGADVGLKPEESDVTVGYHFARHWEVDASASAESSAVDVKSTIDIK